MRKEELNEIYWLNKEIEDLENRLQELEEEDGLKASSFNETTKSNSNQSIVERVALKKVELQNQLYQNKLLILEEKSKIESFIEKIPNSKLRTIVRLRNIDLLTWEEIAKALSMTRKTATNQYNEFISSLKKDLEKRKEKNK
jgi:DNA-directed RNA polymerase specialized sigma24 family protein